MQRTARLIAAAGAATIVLGGLPAAAATASTARGPAAARASASTASTSGTTRLVGIRAAHHPGFDRFVLVFSGPLPAERSVTWVDRVVRDPSGLPLRLVGNRFLRVRVFSAVAHTAAGTPTVGRRGYRMPNITQSALAGDFEGVVTLGIGLQRKTTKHVFTLSSPSRLVIDVTTPYQTTPVRVYYLNADRFANGTEPFVTPRWRPAIPPRVARQAMMRLFAGPTRWERRHALRFVRSDATGFTDLSITNGIARVRLTGGCDSHGSTFTIANEIIPTLKWFASVDHVKVYGPAGHTERPTGDVDSIPVCLEP